MDLYTDYYSDDDNYNEFDNYDYTQNYTDLGTGTFNRDDYDDDNLDGGDYGGDIYLEEDYGGEDGFDEEIKDKFVEFEIMPEVNVFDRVGLPGAVLVPQIKDIRKSTAKERFVNFMDAMARQLSNSTEEYGRVILTDYDISILIDKTEKLSGIDYKNPLGYIVGYYISNGKGKIDVEKLNFIFQDRILEKLNMLQSTANMKKPDVIRYGRLWSSL